MELEITKGWLKHSQFTKAVEALPLISIDLCVTDDQNQLLVGLRNNRPARGWWFTPGGRIRKNEAIPDAIARIGIDELSLRGLTQERMTLMGVWDHFYPDSAFDHCTSTHYVNIPFWLKLNSAEIDLLDLSGTLGPGRQHSKWLWTNLNEAKVNADIHPHVQPYVAWLADQTHYLSQYVRS